MKHAGERPDDAPEQPGTAPRSFRGRFFGGYDRAEVDAFVLQNAGESVDLREQLMSRCEELDQLRDEQRRLRTELRYWNDRQTFIDGELDRVRADAERIENDARERASNVEKRAQDRALQLVDRVCVEANTILVNAREEAHAMFARQEDDLDVSRRRVERMTQLQLEITSALRAAMQQFERGMHEIESVAPSLRANLASSMHAGQQSPDSISRVGAQLEHSEQPDGAGMAAPQHGPLQRRPVRTTPTFGRARAMAAAGLSEDVQPDPREIFSSDPGATTAVQGTDAPITTP